MVDNDGREATTANRWGHIAKVAVVGVAAIAVGFAVTMSISATIDTHQAAPPAPIALALLQSTQRAQDRLPATIDPEILGTGGVTPSSVRLLGSDARGTYWAARDEEGEVCLVIRVAHTDTAASGCVTPASFASKGIALAVIGPGDVDPPFAEAYLLPDRTTVPGVDGVLTTLGDNLLVGDTRTFSGDRDFGGRTGGGSAFQFRLLSPEPIRSARDDSG